MDATLSKHIKTIEQMIQNKSSNIVQVGDNEYVPTISQNESKEMNALYQYLGEIRDFKKGDTHYWKKQMFLDRGINISKMEDAYKAKADNRKAEKLAEKEVERKRKKRAREETFDEDVKQIKINRYNRAMEMKKKIEALKASKSAAKAKT